jgi:2'-5' RNA ligase
MSQKYVIVHFIEPTKVPQEFTAKEWPLHITLLSNFQITPLSLLEKELAIYAHNTKPFDVITDGEALFGPNKNIAVSLIRPDEALINMHTQLLSIATELGAVYDEVAFMSEGYRPHATIQASSRLLDGQKVTLNDFTLVDMYPNNDIARRRIIKTFSLTD